MAERFLASLELDGRTGSAPVPVADLTVREEYSAGWAGRAVLALAADAPLGIGEIFGAVLARGVVPGTGVIVHLSLADEEAPPEDRGRTVRSWPCVISRIEPESPPPDASRAECVVDFVDPIRRLHAVSIHGVFAECSVGEMSGGAISLAAGMDGAPTRTPVLPGTGSLTVVEETREALSSIPYSIACGESLAEWLERVHAPLGVRSELRGLDDGGLEWRLSDRVPGGEPLSMSLDSREGGTGGEGGGEDGPEPGAVRIRAMHGRAGAIRRGAVLDDIEEAALWRFESDLPVGTLIEGAGVGPDEAWLRSTFDDQRADLELLTLDVESCEPVLRPGGLIRIEGLELADIELWQFGRVVHEVRGGTYVNRALVLRGDAAWRPGLPAAPVPRTVTAFVAGDDEALPSEPVPRDRIGRVPVRFSFGIAAAAAAADEDDDKDKDKDGGSGEARISLPVVQPMAGALHGFAPGHRAGDVCRVTVHTPFSAEIDGFVYREARPVYDGGGLAPGWAGIIVEHDGKKAWSGWAFEPAPEDPA